MNLQLKFIFSYFLNLLVYLFINIFDFTLFKFLFYSALLKILLILSNIFFKMCLNLDYKLSDFLDVKIHSKLKLKLSSKISVSIFKLINTVSHSKSKSEEVNWSFHSYEQYKQWYQFSSSVWLMEHWMLNYSGCKF